MDNRQISRKCPQCGAAFRPFTGKRGKPATFCAPVCRMAYVTTDRARGELILSVAQVWRQERKGKSDLGRYAFSALCAALDEFNVEDRVKGRRSDLIAKRKFADNWSIKDRR